MVGGAAVRFRGVLAVNWTQRAPIRAKDGPSTERVNDRCHWGSLGMSRQVLDLVGCGGRT